MCWLTKNVSYTHKKKTNEDTTVYKVVTPGRVCKDICHSLIYDYTYGIGKLNIPIYIKPIFDEEQEVYYINKGYHSYRDLREPTRVYQEHMMGGMYCLLAICIIPKGTDYYENASGEIVSSNIIIKQVSCL